MTCCVFDVTRSIPGKESSTYIVGAGVIDESPEPSHADNNKIENMAKKTNFMFLKIQKHQGRSKGTFFFTIS